MSETPQHASYCGNASGPDPLCGGCGMSETPQSVLERYIRDGGIITLPHIREAIRAVLELVAVQYRVNEELGRDLTEAEAERDALRAELRRAEKFWASAQERADVANVALLDAVKVRGQLRAAEAALRDMTFDQWGAPTCWPNQDRVMEILRDTAPRREEE